jgi:hypothetical protein
MNSFKKLIIINVINILIVTIFYFLIGYYHPTLLVFNTHNPIFRYHLYAVTVGLLL